MVIDTNVPIVANGGSHPGPGCVQACIVELLATQKRKRILLDNLQLILDEYQRYLKHAGQPGPGDAFFKWLWNNQANPRHCVKVAVTPTDNEHGGFAEFPDDPDLTAFDTNDRKFVAVAIASGVNPLVVNASDSDWWNHRDALLKNGVRVQFLCPELMSTRQRHSP